MSLSTNDAAKAERVFGALSEGGNLIMPMAKTFWAERFGMLVDRYGIRWTVNCEGQQQG